MGIPKSLLTQLMLAIPFDRLLAIARDNFTRMQSEFTHEELAARVSTLPRVQEILFDLNFPELKTLAAILKIDPSGISESDLCAAVSDSLVYYDQRKSGDKVSSAETLEMLKKGTSYDKLWSQLDKRKALNGPECLSAGERVIETVMGAAFQAKIMGADGSNVFSKCCLDWPEPMLSHLNAVGAVKTAQLLIDQIQMMFPESGANLTGKALLDAALKYMCNPNNEAKRRKAWRESWKSTGEDVDSLARHYLLANPELF